MLPAKAHAAALLFLEPYVAYAHAPQVDDYLASVHASIASLRALGDIPPSASLLVPDSAASRQSEFDDMPGSSREYHDGSLLRLRLELVLTRCARGRNTDGMGASGAALHVGSSAVMLHRAPLPASQQLAAMFATVLPAMGVRTDVSMQGVMTSSRSPISAAVPVSLLPSPPASAPGSPAYQAADAAAQTAYYTTNAKW
ncbi:MAG: hypothetical protein EOO41_05465 [Methanobacteriota archaeon]|nr:MAG: hypothetical protein EOO41_05465 [Euryarchaeota archaeon]